MRGILTISLMYVSILLNAATYYVAPTTHPTTPGSDSRTAAQAQNIATPWATWQKAINSVVAGDTIYLRGGTWYPTTYVGGSGCLVYIGRLYSSNANGTRADPICMFAYPPDYEAGNPPILDGSYATPQSGWMNGIGLEEIQYWKLKGLVVQNLKQELPSGSSMAVGMSSNNCANLYFENCVVRNISGRGNWCTSGAWNAYDGSGAYFASDTTRWINCDAYDICDTLSANPGNAGDGWKCHNYEYNLFYWENCRAWYYSDDGFDPSGSGAREFRGCWAMASSKYAEFDIEGNGFKTAGTSVPVTPDLPNQNRARFYNCIAVNCPSKGFYNNLEAGSTGDPRSSNPIYYNNSTYLCETGYADVYSTTGIISRNNIAYAHTSDTYTQTQIYGTTYTCSNNTWLSTVDWPGWELNPAYSVTNADFISLDYMQLFAARKSDGSKPDVTFMRLADGSDLIDGGYDVGLTYNGSAPDLGAWEYGTYETSSATDILTFTLPVQTGEAIINAITHTVAIEVAYTADVTNLTPTITLSYGATINPLSGVSQNFTSPVTYTVTALDGTTTQEWVVTVAQEEEPPSPTGSSRIVKYRGLILKL